MIHRVLLSEAKREKDHSFKFFVCGFDVSFGVFERNALRFD